ANALNSKSGKASLGGFQSANSDQSSAPAALAASPALATGSAATPRQSHPPASETGQAKKTSNLPPGVNPAPDYTTVNPAAWMFPANAAVLPSVADPRLEKTTGDSVTVRQTSSL